MKHPQIKTIVLTGGSSKNDKDYLMGISRAMKVDLVMSKPFFINDLRNAVKRITTEAIANQGGTSGTNES